MLLCGGGTEAEDYLALEGGRRERERETERRRQRETEGGERASWLYRTPRILS